MSATTDSTIGRPSKRSKTSDNNNKTTGDDNEDNNKSLKTTADDDHHFGHQSYGRQSMDRFGDDLYELVVSYLPIGDKLRLECVSKQWRRLIFTGHRSLRLTSIRTSDDHIPGLIHNAAGSRYQAIDRQALAVVLRKLIRLQTIRIEGRITVDSQLIQLIADESPAIQHLAISVRYIHDINAQCLRHFGLRCGPTLKSIKFDGLTDRQMKQLLKWTPNLTTIIVDNIKTILGTDGQQPAPLLPRLQELQFCRCNTQVLSQLAAQYGPSLTKIKTHLLTIDLQSDDMNEALAGFARFSSLSALDVFVDVCDATDVQSIDAGLRQLATNARALKHLYFTLDGNLLQSNLFQRFGRFETLRSLEIVITSDHLLGDYSYDYGPIDALRPLRHLRHLNLHLEHMTDQNVVNIDRNLPRLVSVRLNSARALSDRSLASLSRLKRLQRLEIICLTVDNTANITDEGVCQVIHSCPQIQSLMLDQKNTLFDFEITRQSVDAMVTRARRQHKITFNLSFAINTKPNELEYQSYSPTIEMPNNLSIEVL